MRNFVVEKHCLTSEVAFLDETGSLLNITQVTTTKFITEVGEIILLKSSSSSLIVHDHLGLTFFPIPYFGYIENTFF